MPRLIGTFHLVDPNKRGCRHLRCCEGSGSQDQVLCGGVVATNSRRSAVFGKGRSSKRTSWRLRAFLKKNHSADIPASTVPGASFFSWSRYNWKTAQMLGSQSVRRLTEILCLR